MEIPGRKLRDFRLPHAETAALVISALSFAGLIYLARHGSFFYDEWDYVFGDASFTPRMLLQPHNEHASLIPRAIYWTMFRFFGLRTYFPYLVWVVAFHVGTGLALFHFIKERSGDLVALLSMLVFLFLGAGYEDIIQPFQMSFDASTMFGLAAFQLLSSSLAGQSRHSVAAGLALLASLMASGIGIAFAIACGTYLVLAKDRQRLLAVAVPVAVFLAWFATLGHANFGHSTAVNRAPTPEEVAMYVATGLTSYLAGLGGFPTVAGPLLLPLAALGLGVAWGKSGRVSPVVDAALAAILSFVLLTALGRAQMGAWEAASPRYIHVMAVFILIVGAELVAPVPWHRFAGPLAVALVLAVSCHNAMLLRQKTWDHNEWIARQSAELQVVALMRGSTGLSLDAPIDSELLPQVTPRAYFAAVDRLGSPVPPIDRLPAKYQANTEKALEHVFAPSLRLSPASQASDAVTSCINVTGTADTAARPSERVVLYSDAPAAAMVHMWFLSDLSLAAARVRVSPLAPITVEVPDMPLTVTPHIRVIPLTGESIRVCRS